MYRIIKFLTDNRSSVIWVFLQLLCFIFIINFNNYQRHIVGDIVLSVSGKMQERRSNLKYYFNLTEENDVLKRENLVLYQRIETLKSRLSYAESALKLDSNKMMAYDTLRLQKEFYKYIPCRVMNNTTEKNYNYITLDKGAKDGVKVGMGVISSRGVAGKIIRVNDNYALALSLLNLNFTLSVKNSRTDNEGQYAWEGESSRYGYLKHVPQDVELKVGDSIVTTGFGSVFPKGFMVGVIYDNTEIISGFYKAKIALSTNFDAINDLYIVESTHQNAVDSLMQGLPQ